MKYHGKICGKSADKYPSHRYLKPIVRPCDIFSLDPWRLDPMHEFPRGTGMDKPNLPVEHFLDYTVEVQFTECQKVVSLYIEPNEFTEATDRRLVTVFDADPMIENSVLVDHALQLAFR